MISPIDSDYVQYFADTVCPVSAYETKIFQVATDTTGNPDIEVLTKETLMINDEDKGFVDDILTRGQQIVDDTCALESKIMEITNSKI